MEEEKNRAYSLSFAACGKNLVEDFGCSEKKNSSLLCIGIASSPHAGIIAVYIVHCRYNLSFTSKYYWFVNTLLQYIGNNRMKRGHFSLKSASRRSIIKRYYYMSWLATVNTKAKFRVVRTPLTLTIILLP